MKKIFLAISKTKSREGEMQGILYPNGKVEIGIDAWRILDKHDINSYPLYSFKSLSQLRLHYDIRKRRIGFYITQMEEPWNTTIIL